jgi:hypothetical protein
MLFVPGSCGAYLCPAESTWILHPPGKVKLLYTKLKKSKIIKTQTLRNLTRCLVALHGFYRRVRIISGDDGFFTGGGS